MLFFIAFVVGIRRLWPGGEVAARSGEVRDGVHRERVRVYVAKLHQVVIK